ncbi:baseplate J/gp47 family protein [Streptomyces sp. NPDC005195]|uniref:baseplate J/gp47 family protein n=1 Tax=Streptomyces sp. NPDC005195 TaxID=3154561 RepID=UPI0033B274B7
MPLHPPVLDTRRWPDLVAEARALIPLVAPRWTDQNVSDPGIALLELLAWHVDAGMYRAGRTTDPLLRKLLALIGHPPGGARHATAVLALSGNPAQPVELPAGLVLSASRPTSQGPKAGPSPRLTTLHPVRPTGAALTVAGVDDGTAEDTRYTAGWTDRTAALAAGVPYPALGPDPGPGAALVLGLDRELPAGTRLSLYLGLDQGRCGDGTSAASRDDDPKTPHHDARTVWEVRRAGTWQHLDAADVVDGTRALTRGAGVVLHLAQPLAPEALGVLPERAWIRCRQDRGRHDAPPLLTGITVDAVRAELAETAVGSFTVAAGVTPSGGPMPQPPALVPLVLCVNTRGQVEGLRLGVATEAGPLVRVLEWQQPEGQSQGRLVVEAVVAGVGDGTPEQSFALPVVGTVPADRAEVWLCSPDLHARRVTLMPDLDASGRSDRHAVLAPSTGVLTFGDGRHGAVPEVGETVLAICSVGGGSGAGKPAPGLHWALEPSPRNQALLGRPPTPSDPTATLAVAPTGGAEPQDVAAAAARAERAVWVHERLCQALTAAGASSLDELDRNLVRDLDVPERAVTLADFERCALATPGTSITRARAFVETDPRVPGHRAAGCLTVVIVPELPQARPEPSAGLLDAVRSWLATRRTVGTRVFVTGPRYVPVAAQVTAVLRPGADQAATTRAAMAALNRFLHPLTGGPRAGGWPFGRDVHRSEVMQVLDEVPGVDHISALTLLTTDGDRHHSGLPVPADGLVVPGAHTFDIAEGART